MKFLMLYRASVYFSLVLATLVLSFDRAEENRLAMIYPPVVALAGVVALLTVDRNPRLGLSPSLANPLAIVALGLAYLEYESNPAELVLPLGHLLVYLQLIKIFQAKRVEDDWYLLLLGLVQVVVGSYLSQSDLAGLVLFAWVLTSLWSLMLGHLYRESVRSREALAGMTLEPGPPDREPYPGLIDAPFLASVLRVGGATLLLGGLIFLALPRRGDMRNMGGGPAAGQHLSGFSEEVRLGELGEILENTAVVMEVETTDAEGRRLRPAEEVLWRGVSLIQYSNRRWSRPRNSSALAYEDLPNYPSPDPDPSLLRQRILLEATGHDVLFGVRPVLKAQSGRLASPPLLNKSDGSLFRSEVQQGPYEYEVWSHTGGDAPQRGEDPPVGRGIRRTLLDINPSVPRPAGDRLRERLRGIAERAVADRRAGEDPLLRARALEAYLRDSGDFQYTLRQDSIDGNLDPVEDFLVNRKRGHCEYFASALALLLRSIDIPARMVNGFKGGDWNELTGILTVRQKYAHSWVEAWVPDGRGGELWITLDPTPAAREESVRSIGGLRSRFRFLGDFVRQLWFFYVVGFNAERQQRVLYRPILELWREATEGFAIMGGMLRSAFAWLFHFPSLSSIFSVRGFLVTVGLMLAVLAASRFLRRVVRWLLRRLRGAEADDAALAVAAGSYRRLLQVLAEAGLRPGQTETPREFARRAVRSLPSVDDGEAPGTPALPSAVAELYYRVRYGRAEPPLDEVREIDRRIDALGERLRHPGRATT